MEKLGDVLKDMNMFKDIKYEFNAGMCPGCGRNNLTSVNGKIDDICFDCQIMRVIENEKKRPPPKPVGEGILDEIYKDRTWRDWQANNDDNKDVRQRCYDWTKNYKRGDWLLLYGTQGSGKTFMKNLVLKELIKKGLSINNLKLYTLWNEFLDVQNSKKSVMDFHKRLLGYDVLAIDEIGRRSHSKALSNFLFEIVDQYYLDNKTLIFVTNLEVVGDPKSNMDTLSDFIDFSRFKEKTKVIVFTDKDWRLK